MARSTIMMIGIGDLGGHVLELLVRAPGSRRIITADLNEDWAYRKTNIAAFGAAQMDHYPEVEFVKVDLDNIDQTSEIIAKYNPDIIYSAVSLQSWWVINTLPKEVFEQLDVARFGPWLPMHLTLIYKLMQAVQQTQRVGRHRRHITTLSSALRKFIPRGRIAYPPQSARLTLICVS